MNSLERYFSEIRQGFSYQEYCFYGGQLKEKFFSQAADFLKNDQELVSRRQIIFAESARRYASYAGINTSYEQERLYAFLREMMPLGLNEESKEDGDGIFPWQLCDQPLLADVFLLTDDIFSYQQFTDYFPHIFEKGEKKK